MVPWSQNKGNLLNQDSGCQLSASEMLFTQSRETGKYLVCCFVHGVCFCVVVYEVAVELD